MNADGSLDTGFGDTQAGANNTVNATAVGCDGRIFIGGTFTAVNNVGRPYVAALQGDMLAPAILTQPQSRTNLLGSTALFSFSACGTAPLTYQWRRNGANLADNARIAGALTPALSISGVTVADGGSYTVVVANALASSTSMVATLTIDAPIIVAAFTAQPTNGLAPLKVAFTNLSVGATNQTWDFGDGRISAELNPTNTYVNAGIYSVTLTVFGPGGTSSLTRTNYLTFTNAPAPVVADFNATPTSGGAPLAVSFTNLSSGATAYRWDFGDGNSSSNEAPINIYSNSGAYSVTLTAVGPGGSNTLTRANFIAVSGQPPVAGFLAGPTHGDAPLTVSFTNLSVHATSYSWNFGDNHTSADSDPTNTYTIAGTYNLSLTASGADGTNTLVRSNYIVVLMVANSPRLSVSPASLDFGLLVPSQTVQASLVVSNSGLATLTGAAAVSTGNFAILAGTPFQLSPADATNLVMSFTATNAGSFSNWVVVTSNGGDSTNSLSGRAINAPLIVSALAPSGDFTFSFETLAGLTYVIEYKDSLDDPLWQTLQSVPGDGTVQTLTVSAADTAQRFYRLNIQ